MADEHHADAFAFQVMHGAQQLIHFGAGQRGGRFIHNHQTRIGHQCAANRHLLTLGNRQRRDFAVEIQRVIQLSQNALCGFPQAGRTVPAHQPLQVVVKGDVLEHAEIGEQRQILINHLHAKLTCLIR